VRATSFFVENLKSWPLGSETSDMTSKGLGEMFEGDSADMCAGKFPLVSIGGRGEGLACADREQGPPSALADECEMAEASTINS
jgi:hypothetical protein